MMQSKKPLITSLPEPASPKSSDLLLGKYKLGRLLGRGSFAKVFSAQSIKDESPSVAIKIIDKSILLSAGMETQIIREVAVMHRLNHPNIVRIHEVMATKSKIYLVMEYVRGGDLFTKIARRGRLTESMARRYFQQLVTTIQYCHVKGVVHRDIKPQNLLLDQEGNLKVSDFGLAGLQEPVNNGLLQTACGTPAYTAPEVVGRKGYAGPKADAWSCGIILYVFLAGCIPFDDTNLMVMYRKIHKREFEFPPWFSKPVRRIISRLLDPNPDTRMSIEEVLESSWLKTSFQSVPNLCALDTPDGFRDIKVDLLPRARTMNAFEIISMSSGLDLSPLFEKGKKNEKRFTSTSSHEKILERVEEAGAKLGYNVQRMEGGVIGLIKGRLSIFVKVIEVAVSVFLVDLKIGDGEDNEMEDAYWRDLEAGLGDIVVCHNEPICSDKVVCQNEPICRRTTVSL